MSNILLISCPDQKGLVHAITGVILETGGNIIDLEQHVDSQDQHFFMRVEWEGAAHDFEPKFSPLGKRLNMNWELFSSSQKQRLVLFVSRADHCLIDILLRIEAGQLSADVQVIISNYPDLKKRAEQYGINFIYFDITPANQKEQEQKIINLLRDLQIEVIGLARYMKILGPELVRTFENRIINVHHSFLPAFIGGKPYERAHERGVKIIGATSHYVTEKLDDGPIIEQAVRHIGHQFNIDELKEVGREIEKEVFFMGLKKHLEHKIIVHKNRTIIFQ